MRLHRLVPAIILTSLMTVACGLSEVRSCTLVGSDDGIGVEMSKQLFVETGYVTFDVCDDQGCESARRQLGKMPADVDVPVGRGSMVPFKQLGRTFAAGEVEVTVVLYGPRGERVARRKEMVTLTHSYPNGKDCDDGGTSGFLALEASDRL